jgi:AcrR family transcriptional regulator
MATKQNHRTRVGRERKARTEARIIAAAVEVFARNSNAMPVIDEFIAAAGVARGTFYNYFKSTEELLQAASESLEDKLIIAIVHSMKEISDPAERVSYGVRMWLRKAEMDRTWCAFVVRHQVRGALVERELTKDLRAGLQRGIFQGTNIHVARDLVVGAAREAMVRLGTGEAPSTHGADVVRAILRGLGLKEAAVGKALSRPLPPMNG